MHFPVVALCCRSLGGFGCLLGVRMQFRDREVAEDKPDLRRMLVNEQANVPERSPAVRALEVAVLQKRHRRVCRAADMIVLSDPWCGESLQGQSHRLCREVHDLLRVIHVPAWWHREASGT